MPPDIIKTQQEVARKALAPKVTYINPELKQISAIAQDFLDAFWVEQQKDLDELVATIAANIGRELEARCEGEKKKMRENSLISPLESHRINDQEYGIDRTITLIRSITGISPTR